MSADCAYPPTFSPSTPYSPWDELDQCPIVDVRSVSVIAKRSSIRGCKSDKPPPDWKPHRAKVHIIVRNISADLRHKVHVQLTTRVQDRESPDPNRYDYPVFVHQVCEPAHRVFLLQIRQDNHMSADIPTASPSERLKMRSLREEQKWQRPESWSTYVE